MNDKAITGCILGTAVGDALGLPYEGLSPIRACKLLGPPDRYRFMFGRGMISDDTEHTCMVAQSLIESGGNACSEHKSNRSDPTKSPFSGSRAMPWVSPAGPALLVTKRRSEVKGSFETIPKKLKANG